ncbi:GRXCR1 family protein [Megaselia abdita]
MISLVVDRPSNSNNITTSPRRNSSTFNNELNTSRKVSINYKPNGNSYFIESIGELNDKEVSRRKRNEDVDEEQQQPSPSLLPSPSPPASCIEINSSSSDCASAVSESVTSSEKDSHVVKIKISPTIINGTLKVDVNDKTDDNRKVTIVNLLSKEEAILNKQQLQQTPSLKININQTNDMVQQKTTSVGSGNPNQLESPNYLYYMMTSGQFSPSDTLDSGTCSDLDTSGNSGCSSGTTPPLIQKNITPDLHMKSTKLLMNSGISYQRHKNSSSTDPDSDGSESSLSCDSLNSAEYLLLNEPPITLQGSMITKLSFLPDSLLRDIRDRKNSSDTDVSSNSEKFTTFAEIDKIDKIDKFDKLSDKIDKLSEKLESNVLTFKRNVKNSLVDIKPMVEDFQVTPPKFENDKFYNFHINEHKNGLVDRAEKIDETFAGYKDVHNTSATSTIRSNKGTVRGVKNRVRNGIATFLQMQSSMKSFKDKDNGKVVLYTTSMGIIRETYAKCSNMKQILRTLLVKFEERDVFMSYEYQQEIKERMQSDVINVPQLFVEGQHIGNFETVERLNETGELRQLLKPYKSTCAMMTCQMCGGYRLLPCPSCKGSKKSVHRNHFTAEFVALKCMNCDEVGLVKCHNC